MKSTRMLGVSAAGALLGLVTAIGCGGHGDASTGAASGGGESASSSTSASASASTSASSSTSASASTVGAGGGGASASSGPGGGGATGAGGAGGAASATSAGGAGGAGGAAGGGGAAAGGGGAAPVDCPTTQTSRTVGAHRTAVPSLAWWGGGYTLVLDEVVEEHPFTMNLTVEKTDATGALLAGPTPILPADGTTRFWPRVAFSGSQYGVAYLEGAGRTPTFLRTDAALNFIPGSKAALGASNGGAVAIAWSDHRWAVTWTRHDASGEMVVLQRFDASGAPIGQLEELGFGYVSENGVPMIPTATGWAILSTGYPARVIEVDAGGASRSVDLPFNGTRGSLASNGSVYAVAVEATNPANPGAFAFVQVGGGVVPGSVATINGSYVELPNVIWTGTEFVVSWTQSTASSAVPLLRATVAPGSSPGQIFGGPFTTHPSAGTHQLAAGSCGWAVVYEPYTSGLDYLEVQP